MAEDRDDQQSNETEGQQNQPQTTDQQGQQQPGQQQQGQETMSGQPIGGNDSNSGSGTPLSQGAMSVARAPASKPHRAVRRAKAAIPRPSAASRTLAVRAEARAAPAEAPAAKALSGRRVPNSDEYVQDNATGQSGSDESDKTDFADQGQGATDEQDQGIPIRIPVDRAEAPKPSEATTRRVPGSGARRCLRRAPSRGTRLRVRSTGQGSAAPGCGRRRPACADKCPGNSRRGMAEIGEWTRDCNVGQRQAIADQISIVARDHLFQIVEDRRQIVELGLFGRLVIARTAEETRRDDLVEEDFRAARYQDRVREFLEPNGFAAHLGICWNQRGLGEFRLQIMDDRARIGEREVAIPKSRHLPERARLEKFRLGIGKAGGLQVELDAFLAGVGQDLARIG